MKKAAVFLADGFEEIEALSPVDYLRRADVDVVTVAVTNSSAVKNCVISSHNVPVIADLSLDEYFNKFSDNIPDCVICPGGSVGAQNLASCDALLKHLEGAWKNGKVVAAICASPAVVLGKTDILQNMSWTCYPGMETEAAPDYVGNYTNRVVVSDGNLVTARGPGASEEFAMELVRILAGADVADRIRKGSQQR